MSSRPCPNEHETCPLYETGCYSDVHHLAYERGDYRANVERAWRDLPINKVQVCRAIHNAIHASGYVPEKPLRREMARELWNGAVTERSDEELHRQLAIGETALLEEWPEELTESFGENHAQQNLDR